MTIQGKKLLHAFLSRSARDDNARIAEALQMDPEELRMAARDIISVIAKRRDNRDTDNL